jgi:8-oxo-dGTP pyrophosphatase MutT (NUDIX family)
VAEKFVGGAHDEDDPTRGAGVALREPGGKLLFVKRNGTGDEAGTWAFPGGFARRGESEQAAAIRELGEELGMLLRQPLRVRFDSARPDGFTFSTFVHDVEKEFAPDLNEELSEYKWSGLDDLPQPLHPGVDRMLKEVSGDPIAGSAMDEAEVDKTEVNYGPGKGDDRCGKCTHFLSPDACEIVRGNIDPDYWCERFSAARIGADSNDIFAFDRATVRRTDADGRLHVEVTNISKANVCPYLGREIPDWESLGLQPDRIYQLLRDPDELRKAAPTFNNLPLLSQHVPVSATDHQPDLVIGSTGTDAGFSHPYLKNSLVVWAKDAIDAIESGDQKELSSAYRYRADMTPGNYQGARYDGIMRGIVGNHVALVKEGRAGTDVVVGDSRDAVTEQQQKEKHPMKSLSRMGLLVSGALTALLTPRLAQDAKLPDLSDVLKDVTAKNFVEMKPQIVAGITAAFKDVKLAKDASLEDMHGFIDRLDDAAAAATDEDVGGGNKEEDEKKGAFDEEQSNGLKEFLKDKLSEDNMKALDAYLAGDEPPAFAGQPVKEGQDEENQEVNKQAMDEAIKVAAENATRKAIQQQQAIREAERFVRPYVGELGVACDSAEAVHRAAAKILGIKGADTVHPDALTALIEAQPKAGEKRQSAEPVVALDAAVIDDFHKMFPSAQRIGVM